MKANVPPSSSVPGGTQHSIRLIHEPNTWQWPQKSKCSFLEVKKPWKHRKVCHMKHYKEKHTNPNLDVKKKNLNIEKLETVAHQKCWITVFCESCKFLLTQKYLCTTKAYWLNIWGISGLEHFPYMLEL